VDPSNDLPEYLTVPDLGVCFCSQ